MSRELTPLGLARARFERSAPTWIDSLAARAETVGLIPAQVYAAAELAALAAPDDGIERRALTLVAVGASAALAEGSTRLAVEGDCVRMSELFAPWVREVPSVGDMLAAVPDVLRSDTAGVIVGCPGDYRPLVFDPPYVQIHRVRDREDALIRRLEARFATPARAEPAVASDPQTAASLTDEQRAAVAAAVRWPLALITGGPGTGKTTIVAAILEALATGGAGDIAIAAPTGKAAKRLAESLGERFERFAPQTLHRLLGTSRGGDRVRFHERNPLPHEVVIVDEASMVDLFMMERLLAAVAPDARLVLLGDADQLPSVEAGAVFRDLIARGDDRVVRLQKSFRMSGDDPAGRAIQLAARAINEGRAELPFERRPDVDALAFTGAESCFGAVSQDAFLDTWTTRVLDTALRDRVARSRIAVEDGFVTDDGVTALLASYASARVLCVTRSDAARINRALHRRGVARVGGTGAFNLSAGDPVMMTRNDYPRALFNGDQGVLAWAEGDAGSARLVALFPAGDRIRAIPFVAIRHHLVLVYAQTVHKSQGSEFDVVALWLPEHDLPLLTREILYTALTRSRRSAVVLGDAGLLAAGVKRRLTRTSRLA